MHQTPQRPPPAPGQSRWPHDALAPSEGCPQPQPAGSVPISQTPTASYAGPYLSLADSDFSFMKSLRLSSRSLVTAPPSRLLLPHGTVTGAGLPTSPAAHYAGHRSHLRQHPPSHRPAWESYTQARNCSLTPGGLQHPAWASDLFLAHLSTVCLTSG